MFRTPAWHCVSRVWFGQTLSENGIPATRGERGWHRRAGLGSAGLPRPGAPSLKLSTPDDYATIHGRRYLGRCYFPSGHVLHNPEEVHMLRLIAGKSSIKAALMGICAAGAGRSFSES